MNKCKRCWSHAINPGFHGRGGSNPDLCDVCYWRSRAEWLQKALRNIASCKPHHPEDVVSIAKAALAKLNKEDKA